MYGYDPFYWYEWELDRQYIAELNGYDNYDDYYNAMKEAKENQDFDLWHDEQ